MKGELIDNKFHEKWYKIDFNEDKNTLLIKKVIDSTTNKSRLYLDDVFTLTMGLRIHKR